MSAEDLEKYETEMELSLYREYKDIVGQFSYVVETERRFYLANSVELMPRNADGEVYFELRLCRRLGVGHVPAGAVRQAGAGGHLQGRQHRRGREARAAAAGITGPPGPRSGGQLIVAERQFAAVVDDRAGHVGQLDVQILGVAGAAR